MEWAPSSKPKVIWHIHLLRLDMRPQGSKFVGLLIDASKEPETSSNKMTNPTKVSICSTCK